MKVSLSWLREYVPVTMPTEELADALTMIGLEVDAIHNRFGSLDGVVVSRIVDIKPHPNADKLSLCQVDVGGEQMLSIVCGAPNAALGLVIPCALPGATLPNGITIKKGKLRGELSEGMLCSASELGLSLEKSGIMELETQAAPGTPLVQALGLNDATLELGVTPNRPDCLSIIGVAREVGAFSNPRSKVNYPSSDTAEPSKAYGKIGEYTSVEILNPELCPRYAAQLVFDVKVGPSPFWLQDRLISVGLKPINNIVDVTNFIMMETGQPLHAFDFDRLAQNRIIVRAASDGESFTTLDNKAHTLDREMLMICDGEKPVALAGVMGGLNSEIQEDTTRVLIESAYFNPSCIRKTSKKTALSTDAAYRFERGIDPEGTIYAVNRAASLITTLGKGNLVDGVIDEYPAPIALREIIMSVKAVNKRLGTDLKRDEIKACLEAIELAVAVVDDDTLRVVPPPFRVDIERPEDLSEEVARIWGYNQIKTTFPPIPAEAVEPTPNIEVKNTIRNLFTGFGFYETINYSFIHQSCCDRMRLPENDPRRALIDIMNPLSEDQSVMRTSLVPGLLQNVQHNNSRQVRDLSLFEIGKVFYKKAEGELSDEVEMFAGVITGTPREQAWHSKERPCDFYDLKGVLEGFFKAIFLDKIVFEPLLSDDCHYLRKGYSAKLSVNGAAIGTMGKIHQEVIDAFDIRQDVFLFEINLKELVTLVNNERTALPIPRYPFVSRDVTLVCSEHVKAGDLLSCIRQSNEKLVETARLIDLYTGEPIPAGKKSLSFRITYRDQEKTLKDKDVNKVHTRITEMLLAQFDAGLSG
ncbi:MAG: phenylalanine--tRNA ligase subunit beta [Desulfobacteraceae bacterium]|jgi:phenylalanyl-tRNA synthetase beta chain